MIDDMPEENKNDLIETQKQVIGILFEVVKRLQNNNNLDTEYFRLISSEKIRTKNVRLDEIMKEREENSKIVGRLLEQLEI